jgi:hypothetical protein
MTPPESYIRDLERSHDELRAALIVVGRRIRQLIVVRVRVLDDTHKHK